MLRGDMDMLMAGPDLYMDCERPIMRADIGRPVACPFQGKGTLAHWCRMCLITKIHSLEGALVRVAEMASKDAQR